MGKEDEVEGHGRQRDRGEDEDASRGQQVPALVVCREQSGAREVGAQVVGDRGGEVLIQPSQAPEIIKAIATGAMELNASGFYAQGLNDARTQ